MTDLRATARAQVLGSWMPLEMGELSKVCENLISSKCPIAANTEAEIRFHASIPSSVLIGTKAIVEYKIVDQNGKNVACTRFPFEVVEWV